MKKFGQFLATFLVLFGVSTLKAQDNSVLKSFINENDIAIRSVQKNAINLNDAAIQNEVRSLITLQIACVKLFETNQKKSADLAFFVRKSCSDFLKKNAKTSLEYLQLTEKERKFFSNPQPIDAVNTYLSPSDNQKVESLNIKDPHIFDALNTRVN